MITMDEEITEAGQDKFEFKTYAGMLKQLIDESKERPLSIGVNGKWGSGKSSLLNLLAEQLEKDSQKQSNPYIMMKFNAWLYQGYEDARVALLEQLCDTFQNNVIDGMTVVDKTLEMIVKFSKSPLTQIITKVIDPTGTLANGSKVIGTIAESSLAATSSLDRDIQELRKAVEDFLIDRKKQLIILVDDLDRCQPATAIATLEAIRFFVKIDRTVVIIAADKEILAQAVKKQFVLADNELDERASNYFEKLINIEINVPSLSEQDVDNLLEDILQQYSTNSDNQSENKATDGVNQQQSIPSQLVEIFTYHPQFTGNIRKVKQFFNKLNQLEILFKALHKGEHQDEDLVIDADTRLIFIKILMLLELGNPSFFDRALLTSEYCGKGSIFNKEKEDIDCIIAIFKSKEFFLHDNNEVTAADDKFLDLWLALPPNLKRTEYYTMKDLTLREKEVNSINSRVQTIVQVIQFLAQQRPRRQLVNPFPEDFFKEIAEIKTFPDIAFINERKQKGVYANLLLMLFLKQRFEDQDLLYADLNPWRRVSLGLDSMGYLKEHYRSAYNNLIFTLGEEADLIDLGIIPPTRSNRNDLIPFFREIKDSIDNKSLEKEQQDFLFGYFTIHK